MIFGSTSTAKDVLAGIDLTGKTAMVTGATGGLGEETARALVAQGARVTILGRSMDKLNAAAERIKASTGSDVEAGQLELHKPETIHTFAEAWLKQHDTLDILINNAGIMSCPLARTKEGWEMQFATNHLGHFLLTNLLLPALKTGAPARVVSVSSAGHNVAAVDFNDVNYEHRKYSENEAYGQSKTANIWFANELDMRLKSEGIRAFSLHPGGIQTDLGRHLTEEVLNELLELVRTGGGEAGGKTIPQGAATSCYAATSPDLNGKGGLYLVDCQIAEAGDSITNNHAPWAYDEKSESRLWDVSNQMLGTNF